MGGYDAEMRSYKFVGQERAIELTKQKLPSITASIEEQHRAALVKSGKTDQLAGRGDTVHALDA